KDYDLRVLENGGAGVDNSFTIPAPPEGIVDLATISKTESGPTLRSTSDTVKELYVRFHFAVPPAGVKTVSIVWRTPSYTFIGKVDKPYAPTVKSFLKASGPFPHGVWYAILNVNGKTAKRIDIHITS